MFTGDPPRRPSHDDPQRSCSKRLPGDHPSDEPQRKERLLRRLSKDGRFRGPGPKVLQILICSGNYSGEMKQCPPPFFGGNSTFQDKNHQTLVTLEIPADTPR